MKPLFSVGLSLCLSLFFSSSNARAHCQVPCGIYGDHARVEQMREDLATIKKAANQIRQLASKQDALSKNQLSRWVTNKEAHAEKIMRTISDYYMAQKIKPGPPDYQRKLIDHHAVMIASMKCKQTVDPADVKKLSQAIEKLAKYWKR